MGVVGTIISRAPQIVADSLAIGATWYKLWNNRSRGLLGRPSLADVFLRDGKRPRYGIPTCNLKRPSNRHNLLYVRPHIVLVSIELMKRFARALSILNVLHLSLTLLSVSMSHNLRPVASLTPF